MAALALVAIVAAVLVVVLTRGAKPGDEEQIRQVYASFQDAWNNSNFAAFLDTYCEKEQREMEEFGEANVQELRDNKGRFEIKVKSIEVSGDTATASIARKYEDGRGFVDEKEHKLVREDGKWKDCGY